MYVYIVAVFKHNDQTSKSNIDLLTYIILDNFGGANENDLIHTIGNADEQLDELNTMTRSSYIGTADLKDSLASTKVHSL